MLVYNCMHSIAFVAFATGFFLLLSDVYIGLEDYFQARATLNTIIDNVSTEWVIDEAKARLQILNGIENRSLQQGKTEDVEIDLNNQ